MLRTISILALAISVCQAQTLMVKTDAGVQSIPVPIAAAGTVANGALSVLTVDDNTPARFIVEVPVPLLKKGRASAMATGTAASRRQFVESAVQQNIASAVIVREFTSVVNGFSITLRHGDTDRLRTFTDGTKIYPDVAVKSLPAIPSSGDRMFHTTAVSSAAGKGVKVGVLDTGIDYLHEALGGGFGPSFKVAGGYDFVNNDADPMDDNGHGTHVAGIIAGASDSLQGIAPGVTLYAYKVLNAQGEGNASDVIAGIERAIADSVDIINLSLGSPTGDPNDILSTAVNRAVEAGIVVVVAAGNSGDYGAVYSPGLALNALTVGASYGASVASFSSKGPVLTNYGIKPDIVAPGVNVYSARNGGGYIAMSGTSMAAPSVTGIAAIVKQAHPGWTALQVHHAIVSNAIDLHAPVFAQGNGEADAERIASAGTIVSPPHLTFGFDTPSSAVWIKSDTLTVANLGPSSVRYHLVGRMAAAAVTVSCTPSDIMLDPFSEQTIAATVTAQNGMIQNGTDIAQGIFGEILLCGEKDTVEVPFSFFKGNVLQMQFSETPWQVIVHNRRDVAKTVAPHAGIVSLVVEKGAYDVISAFSGSYYVVKERIDVDGMHHLDIDKNDADLTVTVKATNAAGDDIRAGGTPGTYCSLEGILYRPAGYAYLCAGGGMTDAMPDPVKHFSPMSSDYSYGLSLRYQFGNDSSFTYDVSLDSGMTRSQEILFPREEMKKVEMKFDLDSTMSRVFPIAWSSFVSRATSVSVTFYDGRDEPLRYPFLQSAFYAGRTGLFPIVHSQEAYRY